MFYHYSGKMDKIILKMCSLTNIHDGGGQHVTEGRGEEEDRVKALAWVYLGLWTTSIMAN